MKPTNMKTVTRSATNIDQMGDRDLKSDGMKNGSSQSAVKSKWAYNYNGGAAEGNFGRGPTVGNTGNPEASPPPAFSRVPDFKTGAKRAFDGTYGGAAQVRTPGGTRKFDPSATQNYRGDIDSMNVGRGPTKGNAQ